jgi:PqqD family protein of HPr-rel-A system
MNWKLSASHSLSMFEGEDEAVVYNERSGETHLVGAIAASLLQHLRLAPDDVSGMCRSLACHWEFDSDTELQNLVITLADELHALSLIEPCPP